MNTKKTNKPKTENAKKPTKLDDKDLQKVGGGERPTQIKLSE